jgi:heparan-alpha-glucosaminide N-acetyltransferase
MFLMMAEALQFAAVAAARPHSAFWRFLGHEQSHSEWVGCSLHDLIQPSFSFLVGVVLPFSISSRIARGQSRRQMNVHAFARAMILVALGVGLRAINPGQAPWTFEDTLTQIGLGYGFLFLLGFRPAHDQWIAFAIILLGYWAAFAFFPEPAGSPFVAHWNKNGNLGRAFDTWFMNLFPRANPFRYDEEGYVTLNFIPTLATMILGLIAGHVLRDGRSPWQKVRWFLAAALICFTVAIAAGVTGVCPIVKRIWTPSWVLYSGGWCFLFLAAFYTVIEILGWKRWSFPLQVIGMNSIVAYCVANISDTVVDRLSDHFGWNLEHGNSSPNSLLVNGAVALLLIWLLLYALYRRRIFVRI